MLEDFRSKVYDQVSAICRREQTVTLATIDRFSFGKTVLYPIADGPDLWSTTLDGVAYSSRLGVVATESDDGLFSGVERFSVCTHGYTNTEVPPDALTKEVHHPWRQGLDSSVLGKGNQLNILGATLQWRTITHPFGTLTCSPGRIIPSRTVFPLVSPQNSKY
ncbi:hypothetical protein LTR22_024677 [Elasticomyces elasticus]|nr:hypothetical protein LTR22_024677 [Elasticomyces elasticus]